MRKYKDISSQKFGRLTAIRRLGKTKSGHALWLFKCECGKEAIKEMYSVTRGSVRSCGCYHSEIKKSGVRRQHGDCGTRLHRIWKSMKNRCNNPNSDDYKRWYGSKGVRVCEEWNNSYSSFKAWALENGYQEGLSIDRISPYGNYEPDNCRWATAKEQANNKRKVDD